MKWNEIVIVTVTEAVDATTNLLLEVGAKGTVIEDGWDFFHLKDDGSGILKDEKSMPIEGDDVLVKAYFPDTSSFGETLEAIKLAMQQMQTIELPLGKFDLRINDVKEEDWEHSWKAYYHPTRITRFLTVVPYWEEYTPAQADEKLIVMDPGMAFGTGTHPTTIMSLEALEAVMRGGERVLDIGTGSGVLSIAAKALGASDVFAYDIDEVATRQSRENVAFNDYAKDVVIGENNLLSGIKKMEADLIIANILAEILMLMIEDAWDNLKMNGHFILSGIIQSKSDELKEALLQQGFEIAQVKTMGDWYCIICRKPAEDE